MWRLHHLNLFHQLSIFISHFTINAGTTSVCFGLRNISYALNFHHRFSLHIIRTLIFDSVTLGTWRGRLGVMVFLIHRNTNIHMKLPNPNVPTLRVRGPAMSRSNPTIRSPCCYALSRIRRIMTNASKLSRSANKLAWSWHAHVCLINADLKQRHLRCPYLSPFMQGVWVHELHCIVGCRFGCLRNARCQDFVYTLISPAVVNSATSSSVSRSTTGHGLY